MDQKKLHILSLLAALTAATIFGMSFMFSKMALVTAAPTVLLAFRFTVAVAAMSLVIALNALVGKARGKPLFAFSLKGKPVGKLLLLGIVQPVAYFIFENYGILYTSAAVAGTIIAAVPVCCILMDVLVLHERVTRRQVLCALGAVGGDRVPEIDVLGHIGRREEDRAAEPATGLADGDRAVVADVGDGPGVAVAYPLLAVAEAAVVAAGDDRVSDSGGGAAVQLHLPARCKGAVEDQVRAGALVEGGDVVAGLGDQHRHQARIPVCPPRQVGGLGHGLRISIMDTAVSEVGVDDGGASVAELE